SGYAMLVLLLALGLGASGCTRGFYRKRADKEVEQVLTEKDQYSLWKVEQFHAYPDPRARFADPTNPDRPPMPPDDPAAWQLSPHPQRPGKAGVARVEGDGYLRLLEHWDALNRDLAEQEKARVEEKRKLEGTEVSPPLRVPAAPDDTPEPFPAVKDDPGAPPGAPEHPFKLRLE